MSNPHDPYGWSRFFRGDTPVIFPMFYSQPEANNKPKRGGRRGRNQRKAARLISRDELREMYENYDEFEQYMEERVKRQKDKEKEREKMKEAEKKDKMRKFSNFEVALIFTLLAPFIGPWVFKAFNSGMASMASAFVK